MTEPGPWTTLLTYLPTVFLAAFTAWLTSFLTLRRDKATWVKEAQQRTFQECRDEAGAIIAWVRGKGEYPYVPFVYLQLHLFALGAADLVPDLKAIREKAAQLDANHREGNVTSQDVDTRGRGIIGDVIFLCVRLQRHVAASIGLPAHRAITRGEIDA